MATIRRRALVGIGGFAAIALSLVAVDLITNGTKSTHVEFTEPIRALTLDISNGSVTVVATDESTVGIEIEVHGGFALDKVPIVNDLNGTESDGLQPLPYRRRRRWNRPFSF